MLLGSKNKLHNSYTNEHFTFLSKVKNTVGLVRMGVPFAVVTENPLVPTLLSSASFPAADPADSCLFPLQLCDSYHLLITVPCAFPLEYCSHW